MSWLSKNTWLAWVLVGILLLMLLYVLFRPAPSIDNSAAQKTIDSLISVNIRLRNINNISDSTKQVAIDSLAKLSDDLADQAVEDRDHIDALNSTNTTLYNDYQYAKAHKDAPRVDSLCDIVVAKMKIDSAIVSEMMQHSNDAIHNLSSQIFLQNQELTGDHELLENDSLLIAKQIALNKTQETQLTKQAKNSKVKTVAAGILIVAAFIGGVLIAK